MIRSTSPNRERVGSRTRRLAGWAIGCAMVLTLGAAVPAAQAASVLPGDIAAAAAKEADAGIGAYAVFTTPTAEQPDLAIENHLIDLVNGAEEGSVIHGAMYTWTRAPVAQALADAAERGVRVRLAVDGRGSGGWNQNPENAAIPILKDAGFEQLVFCENERGDSSACVSDRPGSINHNKLFTLSRTGGLDDVVWIASHNFTNSQNSNFNNALVVHGDSALHDFYGRYFGELLAQNRDNDFYHSELGRFHSEASSVSSFHSPRATSTGEDAVEPETDTMAELLAEMDTYEPECGVDVAHAQFTGPRLAVATELIRIADLGCDVRIVPGDGMSNYIRGKFEGTKVTIRDLPNVHSKYMVLRGTYDGEQDQRIVFAGSHNMTGPALRRHDETLVMVDRKEVAKAYEANFTTLWMTAGSR